MYFNRNYFILFVFGKLYVILIYLRNFQLYQPNSYIDQSTYLVWIGAILICSLNISTFGQKGKEEFELFGHACASIVAASYVKIRATKSNAASTTAH